MPEDEILVSAPGKKPAPGNSDYTLTFVENELLPQDLEISFQISVNRNNDFSIKALTNYPINILRQMINRDLYSNIQYMPY
jgi:hypothetical protein